MIGCAPSHPNKQLREYQPHAGYRFDALDNGEANTDDVFVCLTFSGGGTRAAALAYGVLQGLRETEIPPATAGGPPRRLLDEIDVISSVSGGSFTAAGFGVWRDELFNGDFEKRFLKQDIQTVLLRILLNPLSIIRLLSVALDRIDVAATYYDDEIFKHRSYADLLNQNQRPFIVVNATNLALGQRFEFTQDDFDVLGSDLASVPLAWSVAASSAFPVLFSPVRLKYFPGPKGSSVIHDLITEDAADIRSQRRHDWAKQLAFAKPAGEPPRYRLDQKGHRYLYLMDGGLSDNLGLSYVIDSYRSGVIHEKIQERKIKRLVVIVVDAGTKPQESIESLPSSPGIFLVTYKTGTTSMDNYCVALLDIMKYLMIEQPEDDRAAVERCEEALGVHCPWADSPLYERHPGMEGHLIHLSFEAIQDQEKRARFQNMATSFCLPVQDVDDLIQMGKTLLTDHPEFRRLVAGLAGSRSSEPTPR